MLVGWFASQWIPPRPPSPLDDLRRMADNELRSRLESYSPAHRPLLWPGRLALLLGAGLFIVAGVKMYRAEEVEAEANEEFR
jgi:hypothetical protein